MRPGREKQRLRQCGVRLIPRAQALLELERTGSYRCPALTNDGRWSVYEDRPSICRLWGAQQAMPCRHGCQPDAGLLDDVTGLHAGGDNGQLGDGPLPTPETIAQAMHTPDLRAGPRSCSAGLSGFARIAAIGHQRSSTASTGPSRTAARRRPAPAGLLFEQHTLLQENSSRAARTAGPDRSTSCALRVRAVQQAVHRGPAPGTTPAGLTDPRRASRRDGRCPGPPPAGYRSRASSTPRSRPGRRAAADRHRVEQLLEHPEGPPQAYDPASDS